MKDFQLIVAVVQGNGDFVAATISTVMCKNLILTSKVRSHHILCS